MNGYVCAFRGRRDGYQVPLALEENGRLDQFITDAYAGSSLLRLSEILPRRFREAVQFRTKPGLPAHRVRCLWKTTLHEHLRHYLGYSRAATYAYADRRYSEAAAARARFAQANLLLYTSYAWEAFTAQYAHQPRRVLFQYHPHSTFEERLLRSDAEMFPEIAHSFARETGQSLPDAAKRRVESCWRHADHIICASSFTRDTLLDAGADSARCVVIPYGVDAFDWPSNTADEGLAGNDKREALQALFVGSGVQRKGLHHLLRAWQQATLPDGSQLTLVCRVLDPGLREIVARTPNVRFLPGVKHSDLNTLYRKSSLLVMPSLIEGFGQVYLEALAAGCPLLGTVHTCLPDLGTEEDGIFLTGIADLEELTSQLERLARLLPDWPELRRRAQACAHAFTWERFRRAVVAQL